MEVEIVKGSETGSFVTTTARTKISQSEKLELTMKNLCSALGIKRIFWKISSRDAKFYKPEGPYAYQSASNTILQLSGAIAVKHAEKSQ